MAISRTEQCPTIPPTFSPFGMRSYESRYSPQVRQSQGKPSKIAVAGISSTDSITSAKKLRSSGLQGANVTPTNPGVTIRPDASITLSASALHSPTSTIRSSTIPMSADRLFPPVPSITVPFLITMSYAIYAPQRYVSHIIAARVGAFSRNH